MKTKLILALCLSALPTFAGGPLPMDEVPENWKEMEIEAKWETHEDQFKKLLQNMRDGEHDKKVSKKFDVEIKAKNEGVPTLMVDQYYDDSRGTLASTNSVVRHRRIYNVPEDSKKFKKLGEKAELENIIDEKQSSWKFDLERVQYKTTPKIIEALWFRVETGNDKKENKKWTSQDVLTGKAHGHQTVEAILHDHPQLNFSDLGVTRELHDIRFRYEFFEIDGKGKTSKEPLYEMSIDVIRRVDPKTGKEIERGFEVELELISDFDENMKKKHLKTLFEIARYFEGKYDMKVSVSSKGGARAGTKAMSCRNIL